PKYVIATNYKIPDKPRRVAATGYQTALEAVINSVPEDYFAAPEVSTESKLLISTFSGLHNSKVCDLLDIFCLAENTDKIRTSIPAQEYPVNVGDFKSDWLQRNTRCSCLPDCVYCHYSIEGSAGQFNKEYVANKPTLL
ncbi:hypothetical protein ILUMI_07980, partial [Ignelater luminosus]